MSRHTDTHTVHKTPSRIRTPLHRDYPSSCILPMTPRCPSRDTDPGVPTTTTTPTPSIHPTQPKTLLQTYKLGYQSLESLRLHPRPHLSPFSPGRRCHYPKGGFHSPLGPGEGGLILLVHPFSFLSESPVLRILVLEMTFTTLFVSPLPPSVRRSVLSTGQDVHIIFCNLIFRVVQVWFPEVRVDRESSVSVGPEAWPQKWIPTLLSGNLSPQPSRRPILGTREPSSLP